MELQKNTDEIVYYIRECNRLIHMKGHEIAESHNLTLDQYHLLLYLYLKEDSPTIGELAKIFEKAQNTISEKVTRLEEKKFIERYQDKDDRRCKRVLITQSGSNLIETIRRERSDKFVKNAIQHMNDDEIHDLIIGLKKLMYYLCKEDCNA